MTIAISTGGASAVLARTMREVPLYENHARSRILLELESGSIDVLIQMTGVGSRMFNQVLLTRYPLE